MTTVTLSVSRVLDGIRFNTKDLGYEKRHICKFTALQALQLLILFPFFSVHPTVSNFYRLSLKFLLNSSHMKGYIVFLQSGNLVVIFICFSALQKH